MPALRIATVDSLGAHVLRGTIAWALAGCASGASVGAGGTTVSGQGGGFTIAATSGIGFRVGEHLDLGLSSTIHFGNWERVSNAYGALNDAAGTGSVECCGKSAPIVTFFKFVGIGLGYMTAWMLATDAVLAGPRLRYYLERYAPTLYFDLGVGGATLLDEDRGDLIVGVGASVAAAYMFNPYTGIEARTTWGNVNDPQWGTFTIGLVIKPKKRIMGLFGKNDLQRPPAPAQPLPPPQPYPPQPYPPQPYPAPLQPPSAQPPSQQPPLQPPSAQPPSP